MRVGKATLAGILDACPEHLKGFVEILGSRAVVSPEVLFVLGSHVPPRDGRPADLLPMLAVLPSGWRWSVCAFGPGESACLVAAAALGGGVRVGFENNLWLPDGRIAADNAELVTRLAGILRALGIPPATTAQTRERFFGGHPGTQGVPVPP